MKTADQTSLNPEYADALLCPRLAALHELYGLLVACMRNHGKRTTHKFRNVDEALLNLLAETAQKEDFVVDGRGSGDGAVAITASRR